MEDFIEMLKYTVPAVVTGLVAYLILQKMIEQENRRHFAEVKKENTKHTTPVKLQAHERIILLLERIDPVQVVNRVIRQGMTAKQIQLEIIRDISQEFDHNITQQLYVSQKCWEEVKKAKEDAIKLLTVVANQTDHAADAYEFSKNLIRIQAEQDFYTSRSAIATVKKEISKLF